jgi:hypothetical protein
MGAGERPGSRRQWNGDIIDTAKTLVMLDLALLKAEDIYPLPPETSLVIIQSWRSACYHLRPTTTLGSKNTQRLLCNIPREPLPIRSIRLFGRDGGRTTKPRYQAPRNMASLALVLWAALEHPDKYPFIIMLADTRSQARLIWQTLPKLFAMLLNHAATSYAQHRRKKMIGALHCFDNLNDYADQIHSSHATILAEGLLMARLRRTTIVRSRKTGLKFERNKAKIDFANLRPVTRDEAKKIRCRARTPVCTQRQADYEKHRLCFTAPSHGPSNKRSPRAVCVCGKGGQAPDAKSVQPCPLSIC